MQLRYDRQGNPLTRSEVEQLFIRGLEYSRVARTRVTLAPGDHISGEGYDHSGGEVSTVWIGLNRQMGDGPPLIFETMVVPSAGSTDFIRTSTEEQASMTHEIEVARLAAQMCCPVVTQVPDVIQPEE